MGKSYRNDAKNDGWRKAKNQKNDRRKPFKFRVKHEEREDGGMFNGAFDTTVERL